MLLRAADRTSVAAQLPGVANLDGDSDASFASGAPFAVCGGKRVHLVNTPEQLEQAAAQLCSLVPGDGDPCELTWDE